MRHLRIFMVLVGLICSTGACASVPVSHGWRARIGGLGPKVVVTNAVPRPYNLPKGMFVDGELFIDGQLAGILASGETRTVYLGSLVRNVVMTFKTFVLPVEGGRKQYIGVVSRTFYSGGGSSDGQDWTITYVQEIR